MENEHKVSHLQADASGSPDSGQAVGSQVPEFYVQCVNEREQFMAGLVLAELRRAQRKHPPMLSPHHGYDVLREELEEARDEIKADNAFKATEEIIQVAASAIRFLIDNPFLAEAERREKWRAVHA